MNSRLTAREPGSIRAFISDASFADIGTAVDYLDTCLALGREEGRGEILAGDRTTLEAGTRVSRSVLWDDVRVAAGAALDECVIADGAVVPPDARFSRLVVAPDDGRRPEPGETRLGALLVSPLDARRRKPGR